MVTHNMSQALELGNKTIMMDHGRIVLEIEGEERGNMTIDGLLQMFKQKTSKSFDNDRILLSE